MTEAADIYSRLDREFPDVTLIEVYRIFSAHYRERSESVSFARLFNEFLAFPKKRHRPISKSAWAFAREVSVFSLKS